jgi:hypothetical protein
MANEKMILAAPEPSSHAFSRQIVLWDQNAKPIKPYQRYKKVVALMLSFIDTDMNSSAEVRIFISSFAVTNTDSCLRIQQVQELAAVFKDDYKFQVIHHPFEPGKAIQQQLNKALADFTHDHADPTTLLIIYYGGHGTGFARPDGQSGYIVAG